MRLFGPSRVSDGGKYALGVKDSGQPSSTRTLSRTQRRIFAVAMLWASIFFISCNNREAVVQGVRYGTDGRTLLAAGRQPQCGCMFLRNVRTAGGRPLLVEARLFGDKTGEAIVAPGEMIRVQFDWAGPGFEDAYVLAVYEVDSETALDSDRPGLGPLNDIRSHLRVERDTLTLPCSNDFCDFGSLGMNRVVHDTRGDLGGDEHQTGVHVTRDGRTIEAVATPGSSGTQCGCVILRNTTPTTDVMLQAALHGHTTGRRLLPGAADAYIGFDAAGGQADDVYVLTVVELDRSSDPTVSSEARTVQPTVSGGIKLTDYVKVVGHVDGMTCSSAAGHIVATLSLRDQAVPLTCPISADQGGLGMWSGGAAPMPARR